MLLFNGFNGYFDAMFFCQGKPNYLLHRKFGVLGLHNKFGNNCKEIKMRHLQKKHYLGNINFAG